jgi:sulfite reductase (NADPH) flavoprotein alpha-component
MFRWITVQLHWLLGITLGVVLALMGITGALISFDDDLLALMNRDVVTVATPTITRLSMNELIERLQIAQPNTQVTSVTVFSEANHSARVVLTPNAPRDTANGQATSSATKPVNKEAPRPRGDTRYVNPYTGELLGDKQLLGQASLKTIERIHRGMIAGDTGRAVVGASTLALVFFALSGLYLRWPRSGALRWQTWFKVHPKLKGRPFLWNLHSVIGTWLLPIYLLSSLTGLYFAYDWYRDGLIKVVNATPPSREQGLLKNFGVNEANKDHTDVVRVWSVFEQHAGSYLQATLTLPQSPKHAVEVRYLSTQASHDRAFDRLFLHPSTAAVLKDERFDNKSAANKLIGSMFMLHSGEYFGVIGQIIMLLASAAMPLFAVTGWLMYLRRRQAKRRAAALSSDRNLVAAELA